MEEKKTLGFELREIHNLIKTIVRKTTPIHDKPPLTQLQAGIMGYLFRHQEQPVYQKNIEEEFRVSRATATNTLQVMERNGMITRSCMDRDARLKRIVMTPMAREDHIKVEMHMKEMDSRIMDGISEEDQKELFRILGLVHANLEEMKNEAEKTGKEDTSC